MNEHPQSPLPVPSPEYVENLERKISQLESKIRALEGKIPETNLLNPNFLSRAFTVWGHLFVAQLLIALPFYCIIFLLGAIGN